MSNTITIKDASNASVVISTTDMAALTFSYPSNVGQMSNGILYFGPDATTLPTPVTSAHPFPVDLINMAIAQGTALGSNKQIMIGGSVSATPPSYTGGQIQPFSIDATGCQRVRLPSDQAAIPTGLIAKSLIAGVTSLPVKSATANMNTTGDTLVVPIVAGKSILVLGYVITFNATFTAYFKPSALSTQLSAKRYGVQYSSSGRSLVPTGCFETGTNQGLSINCASSGSVDGSVEVTYVEV